MIVANSTLVQLMNDGLVRPLDEYVAKYGDNIPDNLKITIDGQIMAIAFMANSQHLHARHPGRGRVEGAPGTYDEVIAAAEAIRAAGIMEHPLVINMETGWNVGEVFNTIYLAHGDFFEPGTANPAIENEAGMKSLAVMAQLAEYATPTT